MQVVAQNLRIGRREIDILARDGSSMVVIEVRTRGTSAWQRPFDSIGRSKRNHLERAAAILWDRDWSKRPGIERVRFDVVAIRFDRPPGERIEYLRAAFASGALDGS
jgi:putative endonuclease